MTEPQFYNHLLIGFAALAVVLCAVLFFISAPYGRHSRRGWGPLIESRWGWLIMEAPASILFFIYYFFDGRHSGPVPALLLIVWQSHYFHRAFLYPFSLRSSRQLPLSVVGFALLFNTVNAYIQARWIFTLAPEASYTNAWLTDVRFLSGVILFYTGYAVAKSADRTLRQLRRPGETHYGIPRKGLFRWVSCPNYLGEILEWAGWALALWSWSGAVFLLWTVANLVPRAYSHHKWYRMTFSDYPPVRKALIPFIL